MTKTMKNCTKIKNEYFKWMYDLVNGDSKYSLSYYKLFNLLHAIEFIPKMKIDDNRSADGIFLRQKFGNRFGYSIDEIDYAFQNQPCSILEMMIALSLRIEEQIMEDSDYGDRTGQWFWNMINSLRLGKMSDEEYDQDYVIHVMELFISREYNPDGEGSLFHLKNPPEDMRSADIWCQAMWFLNENFVFKL